MTKRIEDKINEIKLFLDQLNEIEPSSLKEYKENIEKRAACERFAEKIIEAIVDLAFLVIKLKKFDIPEDDIDAFNILVNQGVIDEKIAVKLKNAKGMRNIIAHQYGKIDDEIIFNSITSELEKDTKEFLKEIKNILKKG